MILLSVIATCQSRDFGIANCAGILGLNLYLEAYYKGQQLRQDQDKIGQSKLSFWKNEQHLEE